MLGKLLGNRYEIMEQLGGGGMAIVYKGRDTILNRLVTIKVLRSEYNSDEEFVKRFRREAQAVASLSHPNIVNIYDVGRADDVDYLVMEYIEGDNLKNLIRLHGPLTPVKSAQIALQICDALGHAHENDIVHRDVKPQNILITRDGRAKLTDFGIAMGATAATLTQTDAVLGSVHYLSPEQARGEKIGPRADIYSLGVVLYEMATAKLPFQGDTPVGVALQHIQDEPALPSVINPAIPLQLEKIIVRAMAKKPAGRYETALQMSRELENIAGVGPAKDTRQADADDEFATMVIPTVRGAAVDDDQPMPRQAPVKKKSYRWLWVTLVVLALSAAGAAAFYQYYLNVKEITMPDVVGQNQDEAKRILTEHGVDVANNVSVVDGYDSEIAVGKIYAQEPVAKSTMKVNRTVTLHVSKGPEKRTVPAVVGRSRDEAENLLKKNDLSVELISEEYNDERPQGEVLRQEPAANVKVNKGSSVILTVSKGKLPVSVPDLTKLTEAQAREELAKVNLLLAANIKSERNTVYEKGLVIAQEPVAGTKVQEGSSVSVTLNSGPGPAEVGLYYKGDNTPHLVRVEVIDNDGTWTFFEGTLRNEDKVFLVPYKGKTSIRVYQDDRFERGVDFE